MTKPESAAGGVNRRRAARTKRRIMVRYGPSGPVRTGFTKNLSETGLFVRSNQVYPPGTTLHVEVQFPERTFHLWAKVMWAKRVPAQLSHVLDCGMGLHFLEPDAGFLEYFRDWRKGV